MAYTEKCISHLEHRLFSAAILIFGSVALVASLMHPHNDSGVVTGVAISQRAVSWFNSIYYLIFTLSSFCLPA